MGRKGHRATFGAALILSTTACTPELKGTATSSAKGDQIVVDVAIEGTPGTRVSADLEIASKRSEATIGADGTAKLQLLVPQTLDKSGLKLLSVQLTLRGTKDGTFGVKSAPPVDVEVPWPAAVRCEHGTFTWVPFLVGEIGSGLDVKVASKARAVKTITLGNATQPAPPEEGSVDFRLEDVLAADQPLFKLFKGEAEVKVALELADGQRAATTCKLGPDGVAGALRKALLGTEGKPAKVAEGPPKALAALATGRGTSAFLVGEPVGLEDLAFVALLDESERTESCSFQSGMTARLHTTDVTARVYDRKTGRVVGTRSLRGSGCPTGIVETTNWELRRQTYDWPELKAWLEGFLRAG